MATARAQARMKAYAVDGVGHVLEVRNAWYDRGLRALESCGADFTRLTARNTALIRTQLPFDHPLNARGNWIFGEVMYGLQGLGHPLLVLGPGPVYHNPERAALAHDIGSHLFLDDPQLHHPGDIVFERWDQDLVHLAHSEAAALRNRDASPFELRTFELPEPGSVRISTEALLGVDATRLADPAYFLALSPDVQVAAVLLKDQTPRYAEKLVAALIMELLVMVPDYIDVSTPRPFAEPLWMGSVSVGCGSCIVGCVCGTWMRGIRPSSEHFSIPNS